MENKESVNLHEYMVKMIENFEIKDKIERPKDTVKLYHGTTTAYLRKILIEGLQPRGKTGISNWEEHIASAKNAVYLTNKWHYRYAYSAVDAYMDNKYGEGWEKTDNAWWITAETLPCYIEIEVPKEVLTFDEDIIYQKYFQQLLKSAKKKKKDIALDYRDSLAHAGTVAVVGGVKPEWIVSFTILGDPRFYLDINNERGRYAKDIKRFMRGQGVGSKDLIPYLEMEAKSDLNCTWWTKDLPKGSTYHHVDVNPVTKKIRMHYSIIKPD
ncbi:hypothetical protein [Pseudobutyrivibrio sp.]